MGEAMIRASGLTRRFRDLTAVGNLDFEVPRGELFGIVGPDGAGKTTTLRMLAGVLRPTEGDALVRGISVRKDAEKLKAFTAYMPQRFGLYGDLTVIENIRFYADLYRVPRGERAQRMDRLFAFSGLGPFRDRLAGKLSGGMKQKLGLSCALIHQPEILLLDEPTFGVDPISRRELWHIIHEMIAAGVTAVVSTSYLDEAERFDRLVFLNRGLRIALDSPDALRREFEGELVSARVPRARNAAEIARAVAGVRRVVVFGDKLHFTVDTADRDAAAIESALRREGFAVSDVERIEPTLEDVFIERVARAEGA